MGAEAQEAKTPSNDINETATSIVTLAKKAAQLTRTNQTAFTAYCAIKINLFEKLAKIKPVLSNHSRTVGKQATSLALFYMLKKDYLCKDIFPGIDRKNKEVVKDKTVLLFHLLLSVAMINEFLSSLTDELTSYRTKLDNTRSFPEIKQMDVNIHEKVLISAFDLEEGMLPAVLRIHRKEHYISDTEETRVLDTKAAYFMSCFYEDDAPQTQFEYLKIAHSQISDLPSQTDLANVLEEQIKRVCTNINKPFTTAIEGYIQERSGKDEYTGVLQVADLLSCGMFRNTEFGQAHSRETKLRAANWLKTTYKNGGKADWSKDKFTPTMKAALLEGTLGKHVQETNLATEIRAHRFSH